MTGRRDFDREMTAYLEARSTNRAPDGLLDAAMTRVDRTRQRPGWLIAERWLPMRVTSGVARLGKVAVVFAILALLVALAVVIGVLVGSRHRLPPPFGLAKPGLITFDMAGDIFATNPDGTGLTQLTSGPDPDFLPTYSPDGTLIAYVTALPDLSETVSVMNADGQHRVTLADHMTDVGDISWSPDSRRFAFGARVVGSNVNKIYVVDADHPGATPLGEPGLAGEEASWSPNGKEIAFKGSDACCGPPTLPDALWLMNADGSNAHQLWVPPKEIPTAGSNALKMPAWSTDSTRLAFLAPGVRGAFDVYVINADGLTPAVNITNSPEEEYWPSWSPDGTRVAFPRMSLTPNAGTFIVVDPDGSHPVSLKGPAVDSNMAIWSPDGKRLFGYVFNSNLGYWDVIAIFDASGKDDAALIRAVNFGPASWQRLAP